jgi:hypothetical protein
VGSSNLALALVSSPAPAISAYTYLPYLLAASRKLYDLEAEQDLAEIMQAAAVEVCAKR